MIRILALAVALSAAAAPPASAGSWSFGVGIGFGDPIYFGPAPDPYGPPDYYGPPVLFEPAEPPGYVPAAPIEIAPDGRPVLHMEAADDVLASLGRAGYREFSPMRMRGHFYSVSAVDPNGDLVELQISIFTGDIVGATILNTRNAAPAVLPRAAVAEVAPPPIPPSPGASAESMRDRLLPPADQDPLVVY